MVIPGKRFGMKEIYWRKCYSRGLAGINAATSLFFVNSAILAGVRNFTAAVWARVAYTLQTNQFTGITAAFGGISFGGGTGGMAGVFVGLLILNTFQIGAVEANPSGYKFLRELFACSTYR